MPKKPAKKPVKKTTKSKGTSAATFAVVLEATGLSELKPIKPTRRTVIVKKVKAKATTKSKAKKK